MQTQNKMCYDAIKKQGEKNRAFMDMIKDPINPMTNDDLKQLIAKHPNRYSCFSGFIGKLNS